MKLRLLAFTVLWIAATGAMSYAALTYREDVMVQARMIGADLADLGGAAGADLGDVKNDLSAYVDTKQEALLDIGLSIEEGWAQAQYETKSFIREKTASAKAFAQSLVDGLWPEQLPVIEAPTKPRGGFMNASYDIAPPELTLSEMKQRKKEEAQARDYARIMPAAATAAPWTPEQPALDVEAVLVPRQITVISSSQDGRIASIPVNHGDRFKKGDILISYDCSNLRAEADIAKIEKNYTERRLKGTDNLFKLDIISDVDLAGAQIEDQKASVKDKLYQARLQDCDIRAEFDGRVTNRLANPGEYTRTDRVLLEVASNESLQAEFLVPSKWLRWINIGAPLTITVSETEKTYHAKVARIHGEVDPVSQSIQMIATLDPYDDPLLPGMSGKAAINAADIRNAGIKGYLEVGLPAE